MLAAVKGYYDGKQVVIDEKDRNNLNVGDEVVVTILGQINMRKSETREEMDECIKELRDNDRF